MIRTCPVVLGENGIVCGAPLEATVDRWMTGVVLDETGVVISWGVEVYDLDDGDSRDPGDGARVYCNEDHTYEQMVQALEAVDE